MRTISDFGFRILDLVRAGNGGGIEIAPQPAVEPAFSNSQTAIRKPQSITLHIDELILHGFAASEKHAIAESALRELGWLLAQRGLSAPPAGDISLDHLDGGSFRLPAGGKAATTGSQIAGAVFGAAASVTAPTEMPAAPAPGGETRP